MFDSQHIRNFLSFNLSGGALGGQFIFRRVKSVSFPRKNNPVYSKYILPDEEPVLVNPTTISREELDKSVRITCSSFVGITDNRSIREEPYDVQRKQISFSFDTYRTFDVTGLTFGLMRSEPVVPISSDLVCIWLSANTVIERAYAKVPTADAWFVASDQHLRAFTAILYDTHESLSTIIPKDTSAEEYNAKLKEKLFCGNRLMTNSWLKMKLAHEQNGVEFSRETSAKTYYHLRTDNASKYWVDVWASMVLIARYGELPSKDNVPNTKGGEYQRDTWHIPNGFVENLFKCCGLVMPIHVNTFEPQHEQVQYEEMQCWPDEPEVVKEWAHQQETHSVSLEQGVANNSDMPNLEKVEEIKTKPKRTILEIAMTINWGEAEDDEESKY